MEEHGILEKQERKPVRKECSKCGCINTVEASICSQCSFVLDTRGWQQTKIEEEQKEKETELKISALEKKIIQIDNRYEQDLKDLEVKNRKMMIKMMKNCNIIEN